MANRDGAAEPHPIAEKFIQLVYRAVFMAALAGLLPVSAESETGGKSAPGHQTAPDNKADKIDKNENAKGRLRPRPSPLEELDIETRIEVGDDEDVVRKVGDLLRDQGKLGPHDALDISRKGNIGNHRVIRMRQTHNGVPVFAGQVIAVESGGAVTHVGGSAAADIQIETTPTLDFAQAVAALDGAGPRSFVVAGAGELVVFDIAGGYRLAWRGRVAVDGAPRGLVIDAHNAELLARYPVLLH